MATAANPSVRVFCSACGWRGQRVQRDANNPNQASELAGFGACAHCGEARLRRLHGVRADRKAAQAREQLAAFEPGAAR